eukprot:TRINITY_DN60382_c0_g1_i1.p2 TRINITY_DN60382_c0_g1~~TRINITY_DN60382_c0_g1_i1.p2  ORF type:complete len:173 (-),score=59.66 TRINITY_DN60382_c0_g1_i1:631-1122(-)
MEGSSDVAAARAKLAARFGENRLGGKGSMRRKRKTVHKASTTDDKRLQSTLKRLAVSNIPAIEEVNMFKKDGDVLHFSNPRVQASIQANTYVVTGPAENKSLQDLLPGIINQLGPDSLGNLKKIAEQYAKAAPAADAAAGDDDDDEEPPELVANETFEEASKE